MGRDSIFAPAVKLQINGSLAFTTRNVTNNSHYSATFCHIPDRLPLPYTTNPFEVYAINTPSLMIKQPPQSLYFALCMLILTACSEGQFEIKESWIAEAPPNVTAQAGYLTLANNTSKPMTLISVTSDAFEKIQIHRSVHDKATGLVTMVHEKQADIPAHTTLKFEPGGYHLMLINPKSTLREGDQVTMKLTFADGTEFNITFAIRREKFTL